jgi:uncharacterized hydantoinase/oxoprolinase family protein
MDMQDISTVIDENCTKKGAKKGTQLMLRRVYYQQESGEIACEVKSVFFPFLKIGEIIRKLLSYILYPDFFVITQIICGSCQLLLSAREGTYNTIDIAEKPVCEKAKYLGLSYRLYSVKDAKRNYLKAAARNWVATCHITSYLKLSENYLVIDCRTASTDIAPVSYSTPATLEDNVELHFISERTSYYACGSSREVAQENFQSELRVHPIGLYIPIDN